MSLKTKSHKAPGKCCSMGQGVIPTLNITHCPKEEKKSTYPGKAAESWKNLHENAMI